MENRTDWATALLINAVLAATGPRNPATTARRLAEIGIPMEIIVRLLTRPQDRRQPKNTPSVLPQGELAVRLIEIKQSSPSHGTIDA
jgi:hypothetical protein